MPSVLRNIYEIHSDIVFKDHGISKDELFSKYQPEEFGKSFVDLKTASLLMEHQKLTASMIKVKKESQKLKLENKLLAKNAKKISELEVLVQQSNDDLEAKQIQNQRLAAKVQELEGSLVTVRAILQETQAEVVSVKSVSDDYKDDLEAKQIQNQRLAAKVEELEVSLVTVRANLQETQAEVVSVKSVSDGYKDDLEAKQIQNQRLAAKVEELEGSLVTVKANLKQNEKELVRLELENKGLNEVNRELEVFRPPPPPPLQPFDFEEIVKKGFQNKQQKDTDKSKMPSSDQLLFKFDSEQSLINTLPKTRIKILKQFIAKHEIFLPSMFPPGFNLTNYSFDINSTIFHGPFCVSTNRYRVDHQQPDKPRFDVFWQSDDSNFLKIYFYKHNAGSSCYKLLMDSRTLTFNGTTKYKITSDGNLGDKIY